jgi:hypothetical protein
MKKMKFSGRELAVLRAVDFATGTTGAEIAERTRIEPDELLDILNGLLDAGYVETIPAVERVCAEAFEETLFEVNPAYVHELRGAIIRR